MISSYILHLIYNYFNILDHVMLSWLDIYAFCGMNLYDQTCKFSKHPLCSYTFKYICHYMSVLH